MNDPHNYVFDPLYGPEFYYSKWVDAIANGLSLSEQLHDAVLERDELRLKNDVATDNIRMYCEEIRELQEKLAQAEAELERQKEITVWTLDRAEQAEQRVRELEERVCNTCTYFPDCTYRHAFNNYWNNGPPIRDKWGCNWWSARPTTPEPKEEK